MTRQILSLIWEGKLTGKRNIGFNGGSLDSLDKSATTRKQIELSLKFFINDVLDEKGLLPGVSNEGDYR